MRYKIDTDENLYDDTLSGGDFLMSHETLRIWAFGDAHVGTDIRGGRESLAEAIAQSEGRVPGAPAFDWDIALDVGDMSGGQSVPEDEEGRELVRQFAALQQHARESVYSLCGNHDRSGLAEPEAWWWQKWVDPMGEYTAFSGVDNARRPFAVEGTWERYSFRVGNILFLMMSDINEPTQEKGRGDLGGNPAGVVRGETFQWWKNMVESNQDAIIITAHHYMLKDTTVASGAWEGLIKTADGEWQNGYHGYKPEGAPEGASYLYFVDSVPDAQAFEHYLAEHPGAIDMWIGGHTHAHPDATDGGKSHIESRWGVHFINAAALTKHHVVLPNPPKSRLLMFTNGSRDVCVQCYMHTDEVVPCGWYTPAEQKLTLRKSFHWA